MASYVVTGGCGFIGSHLAERLAAAGHRVRVIDDLSTGRRDNLPAGAELTVGDITVPGAMETVMAGMDGCFHLAAIASVQRSVEDWLGTHRVNQTGTIAVLDAARALGGMPVVYASSAAVYGDNRDLPLVETARPDPLTAYGADKLGSELHAAIAALVHGIPSTGFRFFNVYGPRQDPKSPYSGVISIFADRLLRGQALGVFGDGGQSRDFVFVGDVVDHLCAAMERMTTGARMAGAHVFNVCTGRSITLLELIEAMGRLLGVSPRVEFLPARPGDIRASLGSPSACRAALGIEARTALADGLDVLLRSLGRSCS